MTISDHLVKIKEKCEKLLENASKRTPGEWYPAQGSVGVSPATEKGFVIADVYLSGIENSNFIALCAKYAEAGWRSTIAAIDKALECESWDGMLHEMYLRQDAEEVLKSIIAAWPEELLK